MASEMRNPNLWHKAHRQTKAIIHVQHELQNILIMLGHSQCLNSGSSEHEQPRHSSYLVKLRNGMKQRIMQHHRFVAGTAARAAADITSGVAIAEVECEKDLTELEYWKQGDASLATEENIREREALRFDRRVMDELNVIWQVVVSSSCRLEGGESPDAFAQQTLSQDAHAMMMHRIYRIMLQTYDKDDATETIEKDWKSDAKGKATLNRKEFGDSLFELADTWTSGICPHEYVLFLRKLTSQISEQVAVKPDAFWPDGSPVMESLLKDESSCVYDAETYGEEDEDDDDDQSGDVDGKSGLTSLAGELGSVQHWALRKGDLRRKHVEDDGPQLMGHGAWESKSSGRVEYRSHAKARVKQSFEPPSSVRKIQGQCRGKKARQEAEKRKVSVVKVQCGVRGKLAKNAVELRKRAVVKVQSGIRGKLARNEVRTRKQAVVTIQSHTRSKLARKRVAEMATVKQRLLHPLRKAPSRTEHQATSGRSRSGKGCYWCLVQLADGADAQTADDPPPRMMSSTVTPMAMPFVAVHRSAPTLVNSRSQPRLVRPASAALLRSVVYVPPTPVRPATRPSSAAARVPRVPRIPSADVLRNQRGTWPLPRAASVAVWRKAGQGSTEPLVGPDRYLWYRSSGAMDHWRRTPNRRWDPIHGRLV